MSNHIIAVKRRIAKLKKWLANTSDLSQEELVSLARESKVAAYNFADATGATNSTFVDICSYACVDASEGLKNSADVKYWVERCEEIILNHEQGAKNLVF